MLKKYTKKELAAIYVQVLIIDNSKINSAMRFSFFKHLENDLNARGQSFGSVYKAKSELVDVA